MEDENYISRAYEAIGTTHDALVQEIIRIELIRNGVISSIYIGDIAETIADAVATDLYECADNACWTDDDIRLAVGRTIYGIINR